jgi:hypothetical protein
MPTQNTRSNPASASTDYTRAAQAWTNAWLDQTRNLQENCARFVTERMEHDRATFDRLCGCASLAEAADIQRDWMGKASEAYAQEGRRLFEIALSSPGLMPNISMGSRETRS